MSSTNGRTLKPLIHAQVSYCDEAHLENVGPPADLASQTSRLMCGVWMSLLVRSWCVSEPQKYRILPAYYILKLWDLAFLNNSWGRPCVGASRPLVQWLVWKIECVCISLGARQQRIIGSQSPSRKGRHSTNMTLFIEGEDINCSRGLKKMLGEDGVTCCLEFPVPPHFWRWAPIGPELLTRNVSYLESDIISRSWRKVVQERSYRTPGRMRLLRAQLQLFLRALVCTPWISGSNSTTGSDMSSGTRLQTMPKSSFLIDLNWILSELQLGVQLRPSKVVEMMYHTAQETAQEL